MGQTWTTDCFAGAHEAQTDLQNMETNFATLKSLFSGTSAPSNTVAGMPWFDTTKKVLKVRNTTDAAWVGLMHGDTSQKMWVYRNAAMDGWAVDGAAGIQDKVLAVKGGTTYTTGAATAGSWTVSGITSTCSAPSATINVNSATPDLAVGSQGHLHTITPSQDATWRAAAAVGTLQYLDL